MKNGPYILVVAPENYPGRRYRGRYCYEHTLVWWLHTKNLPLPDEIVHHKDGNKTNNCFDNLECIRKAEHNARHAKGETLITLNCFRCNKIFVRPARHIKVKMKQGQSNFHCSRSCQVSTQQSLRKY